MLLAAQCANLLSFLWLEGELCGALSARREQAGRLGENECSICPASPCSASIRPVTLAVTGCAPTLPAPSAMTAAAPAAATCSATFLRRSARAFACAPAPSPLVRPCVPAPASGTSVSLGAPARPFRAQRGICFSDRSVSLAAISGAGVPPTQILLVGLAANPQNRTRSAVFVGDIAYRRDAVGLFVCERHLQTKRWE